MQTVSISTTTSTTTMMMIRVATKNLLRLWSLFFQQSYEDLKLALTVQACPEAEIWQCHRRAPAARRMQDSRTLHHQKGRSRL